MFYTYEGSIIRESEGGYTVAVPSFECMVAGGTSVKEACENAAGCLQLLIADMLDNDEPLPEATFGSRCRRRPSARPRSWCCAWRWATVSFARACA